MHMVIRENVALAEYVTMQLGGNARYLCIVTSEADIKEALAFSKKHQLKLHVLGGGSNTIFTDNGFDGLVVVNRIPGIIVDKENDGVMLAVGAGEEWDGIVQKSVDLGYVDIAALSLIPGTCGGAPVQNIGAYGQQISDSLISVRAFDIEENEWKTILRKDCNFSYRTSRFNGTDKGRFIITSIKLQLSRKIYEGELYADVECYLLKHGIRASTISPLQLRKAVIAVRRAKLPDPSKIANTGSFFKNPVVSSATFKKLVKEFPFLKSHETDDGKLKLYAGQLIELAGMKDYHDKSTGMATWKNQALVLINEHASHSADLFAFKQKIITSVHATFGITLEQEPELVEG